MTKVQKIQTAIKSLSMKEYLLLRKWFSETDWVKWDNEIERDSIEGKLDFLIKDALEVKAKGILKEL